MYKRPTSVTQRGPRPKRQTASRVLQPAEMALWVSNQLRGKSSAT
eukprot:CAMPEP_0180486778 /NCGR_PEP_ID=MMETSP1036_2-20121128/37173_1 /TAXON_ID=632150 /ORGANISM="Azadinium spinosum, Strain 3D9" /LENGTH=44 /DNA_ID= /DNA_START= /DNA_END= /DNA_ORIENTATION=